MRRTGGRAGPRIDGLGLVGIAGAGIALAALQPSGTVELPASAAVFLACIRFRPVPALAFSGVVVGGLLAVVGVESSNPAASITAVALLCVVLGFVADLAKRARLNQDRAELLLAELEDARESEALVVAAAERARIARELHDVLAHSLSGLSIQLQFARKLAAHQAASPDLRQAVDQAAALTRDGLADAQRAVGALRGDKLPTVDELPDLVERYRRDLRLDVTLKINADGIERLSNEQRSPGSPG